MIKTGRVCLTLTVSSALLVTAVTACSSSGGSSNKLTKAEFITQADAVCASTLAKIKAAPSVTGPTDYADILSYDAIGLAAEPAFIKSITDLVDRSPDAAELHKNWVDVDAADFAAQKPLVEQLDAAAQAKDASKVTSLADKLSAAPDHSAAEAKYLSAYGLTDCASLANFGNSG